MGTRCFYAHSTFAPERDQKTSAAITARRNKNKSVGGSCKAGICCCMLEFCACHVNKSTVCITPIWKRKHVHTMWNMHRCKMWTVEKLLLVCTSFPESWWIIRFHADDSSSLLRTASRDSSLGLNRAFESTISLSRRRCHENHPVLSGPGWKVFAVKKTCNLNLQLEGIGETVWCNMSIPCSSMLDHC